MKGDHVTSESMVHDDLTIRPLASLTEYQACAEFQEEIWGRGFNEKVSAAILMIANRLGGLAAGVFDGEGRLQGFVFGLTGMIDGKQVHWSDMLAVRSGLRDRGLGTLLKLYQRDVLLERGVREMRWTFDPLQGRNAHVNFSKLGIVCREYVEDMYGETGSPLHQGVGTDRLVAIWELDSEEEGTRVSAAEDTYSPDGVSGVPQILPILQEGSFPSPGKPTLGLDNPLLLLAIPGDVDEMMREDISLAIRWREATREAFRHYFSRGYEARGFLRGEEVSLYFLERPGGETEGGRTGANP